MLTYSEADLTKEFVKYFPVRAPKLTFHNGLFVLGFAKTYWVL